MVPSSMYAGQLVREWCVGKGSDYLQQRLNVLEDNLWSSDAAAAVNGPPGCSLSCTPAALGQQECALLLMRLHLHQHPGKRTGGRSCSLRVVSMRAVVQRVKSASITVRQSLHAAAVQWHGQLAMLIPQAVGCHISAGGWQHGVQHRPGANVPGWRQVGRHGGRPGVLVRLCLSYAAPGLWTAYGCRPCW